MSDDLVKHERIWVSWDKIGARVNTHGDKRFTPIDAREYVTADHIEQLAAINEELEAKLAEAVEERDEALNQLDSARHSVAVLEKRVKTFCDGWGIADKGRIEAEAKLAEAVEALEGAAQQHRIIAGMDLIGASAVAYNAARAAESKLASLQGDKT